MYYYIMQFNFTKAPASENNLNPLLADGETDPKKKIPYYSYGEMTEKYFFAYGEIGPIFFLLLIIRQKRGGTNKRRCGKPHIDAGMWRAYSALSGILAERCASGPPHAPSISLLPGTCYVLSTFQNVVCTTNQRHPAYAQPHQDSAVK